MTRRATAPPGRSRWAHRHAQWLFPAPAVVLVATIIVYPIIYTGWMSLQEWFASSLTGPRFIGLANYVKIGMGDARFREAVVRTVYFTLVASASQTTSSRSPASHRFAGPTRVRLRSTRWRSSTSGNGRR